MQQAKEAVAASRRIVFFGGAGTSTESGIPDFRSHNGLFRTQQGTEHPPEEMLSRDFFMAYPEEFYRFYVSHMIHKDARPNAAHLALAELERQGRLAAVVTQNIDGLHQLAGSRRVLELHGSVHRNSCMVCGARYSLGTVIQAGEAGIVPRCETCKGIVKPDVVLYQESLDHELLDEAVRQIAEADMLLVAGTSLSVYPAAGLITHYRGDRLLLINKSPTRYDSYANWIIPDSIGKVMTFLVE
ncbi:NAD-dependent protein deacylase [Paenibacillus koleovorans]|uniref:NAD-dependent protein deacylase n=1 Tax=Paenibacillus koleovorans TaxID=121608 RepID=UPI000FDCA1FD|nr:NAD-dependent protein deacylase [Paenibacillus koleovorans]